MEKNSPFPITHANFTQCWEYMDKQRRKARVKYRISQVAGRLSSLVFMLTLLLGAQILIPVHFPDLFAGKYRVFLQSLPHYPEVSKKLFETILQPDGTLLTHVLTLLGCGYLLAFGCFVAGMLLVLLLYHPFKKKIPQDKPRKEKAAQLISIAKAAHITASNIQPRVCMSALILLYVGVTVFVLYFGFTLNNAAMFQQLLVNSFSQDYGLNMILLGMACCLAFAPLDYLRSLMTFFFVRFTVPYSFVVQAETYSIFAEEELGEHTAEAYAAERKDSAVQIREEALELEKIQAYGKAKELLLEAAICGDVSAMEHYARHCLIAHDTVPARFWLEQCVRSGDASPAAQKMYKRLKQRRRVDVEFLK